MGISEWLRTCEREEGFLDSPYDIHDDYNTQDPGLIHQERGEHLTSDDTFALYEMLNSNAATDYERSLVWKWSARGERKNNSFRAFSEKFVDLLMLLSSVCAWQNGDTYDEDLPAWKWKNIYSLKDVLVCGKLRNWEAVQYFARRTFPECRFHVVSDEARSAVDVHVLSWIEDVISDWVNSSFLGGMAHGSAGAHSVSGDKVQD